MPAQSASQQKYFGMVHAIQKGELSPKSVSPKMRETAKSISKKDATDFARTKTKHLPNKTHKKEAMDAYNQGIVDTLTQHGIDPTPYMQMNKSASAANPRIETAKSMIKQALLGSEWAQSVMLAPEYSTVVHGKLTDGANQQLDFSDDDRKRYIKAAMKKMAQALKS